MDGTRYVPCVTVHEERILLRVLQELRRIMVGQRHGRIEIELSGKDDGSTKIMIETSLSHQDSIPKT